MKTNNNYREIKEILNRWTECVYPSKEALESVLRSEKKLTIYHGVDPTAAHLHLGHSTNYFFLRNLQRLGHKIVLLIGDFTAQIGDPTGKDKSRKSLTKKEVLENCKSYKKQAGKILDFDSKKNPVLLKFNSQWLSRLNLEEIINLASKITSQRMLERDMFQKRLKEKKPIWLHELLYPLFQGYDSVAMNVDVEIGGNDQTFNMLVGRDLMKIYRKKEKFVVTTPLLINKKTGRKLMSKSEGGFVALDDSSDEMYGKTMALPDEVITSCFYLCTEIPNEEIRKIEEGVRSGKINPRDVKAQLAREIVKIYHGEKESLEAEKEFERVFKERKMPSKMPEVLIKEKEINILDLLVRSKLSLSKSEAKRVILQKGIKIDGEVQKDWQKVIKTRKGMIIQAGKRRVVQLR